MNSGPAWGTQGGHAMEGPVPTVIDAGMPAAGDPGAGELAGVGFAGEHTLGGMNSIVIK